ncbi:helix-turn-helix domain-containing protein [Aeromonas veronii]
MSCHLSFCGEIKLAEKKLSLAAAIRTVRKARGLSQEAFSDVSSRTYMSSLERDLKSPTINKLAELCEVMGVHPLTLLTLAYAGSDQTKIDRLLVQVRQELELLGKTDDQ